MASPRGRSRRWNAATGQAMVIFAMASIPMVLMVGLSVDGANLMMQKRIAQNAADAAAMAGGRGLAQGSTASTINTAVSNFATSHTGPFGSTTVASSVFTNSAGTSTGATSGGSIPSGSVGVSVTTQRTVSTYFLTLLNLNSVTVQGTARAVTTATSTAGASLLVLDGSACPAVDLSSSAKIQTGTAGAQINSSCATSTGGLKLSSSAKVETTAPGTVNIVGQCSVSGSAKINGGNCSTSPVRLNEGAAAIADPLATLAVPTHSTPTQSAVNCTGSSTVNISPGIYPSIVATGSCTVNFAAGTYVIDGGTFSAGGSAKFVGSEVFVYIAGSNYPSAGGTFGSLSMGGSGNSFLTPPTSGTYKNLSFFVERTLAIPITISGSAGITGINGSLYAASSTMTIDGSGDSNMQLIVKRLTLTGSADVDIDGSATVWTTSSGAGSVALEW